MTSFKSRIVPPEYVTITKTEILALMDAAKNSDASIAAALIGVAIPCIINALTNIPGPGEGVAFFILNFLVGIVAFIASLIMAIKAWEKRGKSDELLDEIYKAPEVELNVSQGDTSVSITSPSPNAHAGSGD